jgi:hypothetical protein
LVRADQVVEVLAHQTTAFAGKPSRWLLDVVIATGQGAGTAAQWNLGPSHRTLVQTDVEPRGAAHRLIQMLWELDTDASAGVITVRRAPAQDASAHGGLEFTFEPFPPRPT